MVQAIISSVISHGEDNAETKETMRKSTEHPTYAPKAFLK